MPPQVCLKTIASRSRYTLQDRQCQLSHGHTGTCDEFPCLQELEHSHPAVANKIKRDSVMTTGAAWKSEDAGPNRILRWVMLLSDDQLREYGIHMDRLKPQVVAKLREKAATYEQCMEVAKKLTWIVYQMPDAPEPSQDLKAYLESYFGAMTLGSTTCMVCRAPLSFRLFAQAARGKAAVETGHSNPRIHSAENVGFAHRECNIAQGSKTLPEFYNWLNEILSRVNHH